MIRALWTAGTGMGAQQSNLDVISNNLANVNTTGFKKSRADFADLMYQNMRQAGASSGNDTMVPSGIQMGHGTRLVSTQKIYTQGSPQNTGNEYDLAIDGHGFFQITMPDGTLAYTRNGSFQRDGATGRIVTSDGYPLEPEITVPEDTKEITVSSEGIVTVTRPTTTEEIGQITLARFVNPAGLESIGGNLLLETVASGAPIVNNPGEEGTGKLLQQFVEMSNVQVVEEMVNMIVAQRAYEVNSKAIQTADDMLEKAAALKR